MNSRAVLYMLQNFINELSEAARAINSVLNLIAAGAETILVSSRKRTRGGFRSGCGPDGGHISHCNISSETEVESSSCLNFRLETVYCSLVCTHKIQRSVLQGYFLLSSPATTYFCRPRENNQVWSKSSFHHFTTKPKLSFDVR